MSFQAEPGADWRDGRQYAGLTSDEPEQDEADDDSVTLQTDEESTWDSMLDGEEEEAPADEEASTEEEPSAEDETTAEDEENPADEDVDPADTDLDDLTDLNLEDLSEMDPEQLEDLLVEVEDMMEEMGAEAGVPGADGEDTLSVDTSPAEEPPPEEAPAPEPTTYEVQEGDTLWDIAEQHLGDGARWPEIAELNEDVIDDPDLIQVGWQLELPSDSPQPQAEEQPGGQTGTDGQADADGRADAGPQVENAGYGVDDGTEDAENVVLVEDDGSWGEDEASEEVEPPDEDSAEVEQAGATGATEEADTTAAEDEGGDLVIAGVDDSGPGHSDDAPGQGEDHPGLGEGLDADLDVDLDDVGLGVEGDLALHDSGADASLHNLRGAADFDVDDAWWS